MTMKSSDHNIRWARGSSLIELLFAGAATIAAASLAAVGSQGLRAGSHTEIDASNMRTIGQAAALYTADNRGWIVGAPSTSGRALLNDPRAQYGLALEVNGDATQAFDWGGPLAWTYLAPDAMRPERRDERFALLNGTAIPDYMNPSFDPADVDLTPAPGPLGVFADPANARISVPFLDLHQGGLPGAAFQPQLAGSYAAAREFLGWQPSQEGWGLPDWVALEFWGGQGTAFPSAALSSVLRLPGFGGRAALQPPHRPYVDRVGDPARKAFLANGTRFQRSDLPFVVHDVGAQGAHGGPFADSGAWARDLTRAWPAGLNSAGEEMVRLSFRRESHDDVARGNVLFFDGAVRLTTIDEARRPTMWLPRGSLVNPGRLFPEVRDEHPVEVVPIPGIPEFGFARIW